MAQKDNLLTRLEDFIVWFLPHLESFPRNYKFLVGDRSYQKLINAALEAQIREQNLENMIRRAIREELKTAV